MLTGALGPAGKQRGVVLAVTMIVLVTMMLASAALIRSVDTAGVISGNLAFKQSAPHSADVGIEAAIGWLETNNGATLYNDDRANGYFATRQDPDPATTPPQTWDAFWVNVLVGRAVAATDAGGNHTDAAGNQVSYVIHRLCNGSGNPGLAIQPNGLPPPQCSLPPPSATSTCTGNSMGANTSTPLTCNRNLYYYRITARTDGPRNTVSYVQVTVVM
ncbi:hypothetical protein [uncultured Thiodictyon sp.]|uniref:pilus assembly PilX family protein n=1 Tax=uncultured Thiodictyon sp. TaxID=1846217 RepID=UPI0025F91139|nr:hypothetical protein [uncultured Thiodictyon sp.]